MASDGRPWSGAMELKTFAYPVTFALVVGGIAGYFGKIGILSLVLLILTAVAFQLSNNIARIYGDKLDREYVEKEYYERKFEQYRRTGKDMDPVTGTAGDMQEMQMRSMLLASTVFALVLGYGFVLSCTDTTAWTLDALSLTALLLVAVMVVLRYLGTWSWGYRTYGNAILFAIIAATAAGCFYLLAGSFVMAALYPSLGVAALGIAVDNMRDLACEEHDVDLAQTSRPRRTVPLSAGLKGTMILQVASTVFAMVWLVAFPIALGASHIWNYAFVLFYIPMVMDLFSLARAAPSDIPGLRRSLAVSTLLVGVAFFYSLSAANLDVIFLFFII